MGALMCANIPDRSGRSGGTKSTTTMVLESTSPRANSGATQASYAESGWGLGAAGPTREVRAFETGYEFDRKIAASVRRTRSQVQGRPEPKPEALGEPKFVSKLPISVSGEEGYYKGFVSSDSVGQPEGDGSFRTATGVTYTGAWADGKPDGAGTWCDVDGTERAGVWKEGVLSTVDRVRTLKDRFTDGPGERIEYLEKVGYPLNPPSGSFSAWQTLGHTGTLVLGAIASANFDKTDSSVWVLPLAAVLFTQVAIWVWMVLHWWTSAVPRATLRGNVAGVGMMLIPLGFLWMGAILGAPLWDGMSTGYETWFFAIANTQSAFVYLACAAASTVCCTPSFIEERKRLAKEAYSAGMWDGYVDRFAKVTRPYAIDSFLAVVGFGASMWSVNYMSTVAEQENTFYDLIYYTLALGVACMLNGLVLAGMRVSPYFSKAEAGEISRRDQYGMITFVPAQLAKSAFNIKCALYFFKFDRQLKQLDAVAVVTVAFAIWITLVFGGIYIVQWLDGIKRARLFINDDEKKYEGLWGQILSQNSSDIDELSRTCAELPVPRGQPKQPLRGRSAANAAFANFTDLFRRAKLLDPRVQSKTAEWASSDDVTDASGTPAKAAAAPLKTHERAIQKVWRAYSGHVEYLLDISRSCIICSSVAQLRMVLQLINQDENVTILRYKNRLDPTYDGRATAGYRDLSLNLKFTQETEEEEGLVFEVQLLLEAMYAVKTDEGHANYRKFRDLSVA